MKDMLLGLLLAIAIMPLIIVVSSIILLHSRYKYYASGYLRMKLIKFVKYKDQLWDSADTTNGFTVFLNKFSFQIEEGVFLHNHWVTYCDPYSLYWLLKYQRWIKQEIIRNFIDGKKDLTLV
jgi:hypothetical protein